MQAIPYLRVCVLQLEVKREYQDRQIKQSQKCNQPSPVIKGRQISQLKDVLKQE